MTLNLSSALLPPFATPGLPGIAGRIKCAPEDFDVEEIPAYEPSGSGDYVFLWLEKRGMGAEYFTRQVAHRLGVPVGEVGTAGLKDRHAVTRQWVSVPAAVEPQVPHLEGDGIRVLNVSRHGNKLRPGHLHGNRFKVLIREPAKEIDIAAAVSAVIDCIRQQGLPNFYGTQRFGHDGETLQLGLALMHDLPGRKPRNPFLRKLALSAVQSALFNCYLARRMADGLLRTVLPGDVMAKWPFGGMFVAEDVAVEQGRFDRRETVTAGPIFGRKTFPAKDAVAAHEAALLSEAELSRESFTRFGKLLMGSRRHNLVYIDDLTAHAQLDSVQLTFTLPAGSYATVLLREIMKADLTDDETSAEA